MTRVRPRTAALALIAAGLIATAVVAALHVRGHRADAEDRFAAVAQTATRAIAARMRTYEYGLRGLRGAVVAVGVEQFDRARFDAYCATRDMAREFQGTFGFGIARRVPLEQEARFVDETRRAGQPTFTPVQFAPHAGERYLVQYIDPLAANRAQLGRDLASEPRRRAAAEQAIARGAATISEPLTLVQDHERPGRAFLLMLPIYSTDAATADGVVGWSFAALVTDDVLAGIDHTGAFELTLRDGREEFFTTSTEPAALDLVHHTELELYGRTWQIEVRATPAFVATLGPALPLSIPFAGVALSGWLGAVVYLVGARARRRRMVAREHERRAAVVASAPDAIVGEDLAGVITDWNAAAERLFGVRARDAVGRPAAELVQLCATDATTELSANIADGLLVLPDGMVCEVEVSASAVFADDGRRIGTSRTIRDVSAVRRAQRELAALNAELETKVEERTAELEATTRDLRTMIDAFPATISYWDKHLVNRVANQAYLRRHHIDPAALTGRTLREAHGDAIFERQRPRIEAVLRGEPQAFELELPALDGRGTDHLYAQLLPDIVDGEVVGFYALSHDITELVASRQRLAALERDNEALLSTIKSQAIVSVTDRAGRIIEVSDSFCEISGYTRQELLGRTHALINSHVHPPAFWHEMWRTVASGRVWRSEVCNRAKDGSLYWVDSLVSPFRGADGEIERYISIRTDITARKDAEATLVETSTLLTGVLESATEIAVIATDPDGTITVFNRGAERMLGYRAEDMIGRHTPERYHLPSEVAARSAELSAVVGKRIDGFRVFVYQPRQHGVETREWTFVRADGTQLTVSLTVTARRDQEGKILGYLGIAHDVSLQKQIEQSLRDAMHDARKANLAKSRFVANMSHEIRTPMNAVLGLSHLLELTKLDDEQAGLLAKIKLASTSLLAIINHILDLSKIEAAELTLERAPFDLRRVIADVVDLTSVAADAKGIRLEVDALTAPVAVEGDATRLHQILVNLVSNAIKFTERGRVCLAVQVRDEDASHVRIGVAVTDTGIGIAADALDTVFAPFAQADASTTRRFGGTGLGLSIVKQLVTLMGGTIDVTSTLGEGSRFHVELVLPRATRSLTPTSPPPAPLAHERPLAGCRLLVVDDNAINLKVARHILEHAGASVRECSNGQEAVDTVVANAGDIDLVLMDLQMPILDGLDATARIRALGLRLPIIALTAGTLSSERDSARSVGMSDFVSKPFDATALVACIAHHLRVVGPARGAAPANDEWPAIAGIDVDVARQRFHGDAALFRAMLQRMLDDAATLTATREPDELARCLHDLKGVAGTLAAMDLHRLAGDAELALRGDPGHARALVVEIRAAVAALTAAAAVWRREAPRACTIAEADDLAALLELLRRFDLAAVARFDAISAALRARLGDASWAELERQVRGLDFATAARSVEALLAS